MWKLIYGLTTIKEEEEDPFEGRKNEEDEDDKVDTIEKEAQKQDAIVTTEEQKTKQSVKDTIATIKPSTWYKHNCKHYKSEICP